MKSLTVSDRDELDRLNSSVDIAISLRTEWLEKKKHEYAEMDIGDEVYDLKNGTLFGTVISIDRKRHGIDFYDTFLWVMYSIQKTNDMGIEEDDGCKYVTKEKYLEILKSRRDAIDAEILREQSKEFAKQAKVVIQNVRQNVGYFGSLRASHPVEHGSYVDGKRVTSTYYITDGDGKSVPMFQLDGEPEPRRG